MTIANRRGSSTHPDSAAAFRCAICAQDGVPIREQDGVRTLLRCPVCCSSRLDPLPTECDTAKLYGSDYRSKTKGKRFIGPIEWAVRQFHQRRFRALLSQNPNGSSILDIGCGRGDLLAGFKSLNWRVAGTEFNKESVLFNQARGVDVRLGGSDQIPDEVFDVIVLFHVLEHVPDLEKLLAAIGTRSRTGTQLVIEIPNALSICHAWFKGAWFGRDLPNHIHQINPWALAQRLSRTGWEQERTVQWSLEFGPYSLGQSLANAITPAWHNRAYQWLQAPSLRPARLFPALCQLLLVFLGAFFYPLVFALTAPSGKSEIAQLWFRKR